MNLYRAVYLREGKLKGMTFAARNPAMAALFAYTVLEKYAKSLDKGSYVLTVNAVQRQPVKSTVPQYGASQQEHQ